MFLKETRKGYQSIYKTVIGKQVFVKYLGKMPKEQAELLLEIMGTRPDLLLGRSNAQAITEYKRVQRKLALAQIEPSQVTLQLGDFRDLIKEVANDSIDLVLTDPPYPKEYLPLWTDLAREASRVLKPTGFLIAYSGQVHLTKVLNMLSQHLEYYWLGMLFHKGSTGQRFEVNMWNRAKPILFFQKPPRQKQPQWLEDVFISEAPEKDNHIWGQSTETLSKLIETFCPLDGIVLDPFVGGGSTIEAASLTKRQIIAYEIDENTYDRAKQRFHL